MSTNKVADKVIANGYTAGKPLQVISCESGRDGKDSPAQKLANVLAKRTGVETPATAPDGKCASGATRGGEPTVGVNERTGKPGEFKTLIGKPPETTSDKKKDK